MPQVYFNLPADDLAVVDHLADVRDTSRAEVLRELVQEALSARRPAGASYETPGQFRISDVDAWLKAIMAGQPADPDGRYVLRVHPATRLAIARAAYQLLERDAATLLGGTEATATMRSSQYGKAELVVDTGLKPGEWALHEGGGRGSLLNHGQLGYPAGEGKPHRWDTGQDGREGCRFCGHARQHKTLPETRWPGGGGSADMLACPACPGGVCLNPHLPQTINEGKQLRTDGSE